MSEVKVNKISPRSGTTITLGDSGDTFTIPSGVTLSNAGTFTSFQSTGIDDNATSTAITIDSSEHSHFGLTSAPNAGQGGVSVLNYGAILTSRTATTNLAHNEFYNPNGQVGNIKTSGNDLNINASSSLTFYTNNTERMRVNSTGLGIGTTSPSNDFHVSSGGNADFIVSTGANQMDITLTNAGSTDYLIRSDNSPDGMHFRAGSTDVMTIDPNFRVGIGTTSPDSPLDILTSGNSGLEVNTGTSSAHRIYLGNTGGTSVVGTLSNHDFAVISNGSERMRIDSSGNVGIGTSSPAHNLEIVATNSGSINDSLQIRNNTTTTGSGSRLRFITSTDSNSDANGASIASIRNGNDNDLVFEVENSEAMRIDHAGNVGIANSAPSHTLEIGDADGSGRGLGFNLNNNVGHIQTRANLTDTQTHHTFKNPNGTVGTIKTNASATSFNTSSDYRLKENVSYDFDATTRLKQLKPARFNFIADANTTVDGFLAHEVSSVVPEAISGEKDAVDADGNPEYQGIDQSKLVPLLVKTIQELEARITQLENA